jgi:hypothetical protein
MLLNVQPVKLNKDSKNQFLLKLPATEILEQQSFKISKQTLCSAIQMLQNNEFTTLASNNKTSVGLKNTGSNTYVIECRSPHGNYNIPCAPDVMLTTNASSLQTLSRYLYNQILPSYENCVKVSGRMQDVFGFITHKTTQQSSTQTRTDDSFLTDNATSISKLTDIFNNFNTNNMSANDSKHQRKSQKLYSASYAALQLKLAAIFCATANKDNSSMWHVTQNMISDMSSEMQKSLYNSVEPEKHYITLLLKGNSIDERIFRINIAVRYFPPEHIFTKTSMLATMALNASECDSGVMVLTGVRNNVAAAIYHNSDSQTIQQNRLALAAYMA